MIMPTKVSVIVPLRNSGAHITGLLDSLLSQDYPSFEILLVGNQGDTTWSALPSDLDPRVHIIEVELPEGWMGRDSNFKRNRGAEAATGIVLFYTDVKIRHQPDWISTGLRLMRENQVEAVAGIMLGTAESTQSFLGRFTDSALIRRNPDFGQGYILNAQNFGNRESLPITACWAMTRAAYENMGGFDEDARDSYEDYMSAWRAVRAGVEFFVSNLWTVFHKHRSKFKPMQLEYARSARGAAQMFATYPDCPFGRRRAAQVTIVLAMVFVGVVTLLISLVALALGNWQILAGLSAIVTALYVLAGTANTVKAHHWQGFFFPALTGWFILWFALHFAQKLREGGGVSKNNRWLQTMFSLVLPGVK